MPKANTRRVIDKPWEALVIFLVLFFVLSVVLYVVDFVPEPITEPAQDYEVSIPTVTVSSISPAARAQSINLIAGPAPAVLNTMVSVRPTRIVIPKVGVDTPISNPESQNLTVLDDELLRGVVRYPGSATLGEVGSMVLFGHQSYLPIVRNKAFKAFNDIQNLQVGDIVSVYAGDTEYRYAVRTVKLVTTEVGSIPLETIGQTLTLVTCNSLGAKEERNIITADFIGIITK